MIDPSVYVRSKPEVSTPVSTPSSRGTTAVGSVGNVPDGSDGDVSASVLGMWIQYLFGVLPNNAARSEVFCQFAEQLRELASLPGLKDPDWNGLFAGPAPGSHLSALLVIQFELKSRTFTSEEERSVLFGQVKAVITSAISASEGTAKADALVPQRSTRLPNAPNSFLAPKPLTSIQRATVDSLAQALRAGMYDDRECLNLMSTWVQSS